MYFLILVVAPLITALLVLFGAKLVRFFSNAKLQTHATPYTVNAFERALERLNCQIDQSVISEDKETKRYLFNYKGGHFVAVYYLQSDSVRMDSITISFFNSVNVPATDLLLVRRVVESFNDFSIPVKAQANPTDDGVLVNFHINGLRIGPKRQDIDYLNALLDLLFDASRQICSMIDSARQSEYDPLNENSGPYQAVMAYFNERQVNGSATNSSDPWWRLPSLSLPNLLDELVGVSPSQNAAICINGSPYEDSIDVLHPLSLLITDSLDSDNPVSLSPVTIDVVEPDSARRDIHLILRVDQVAPHAIFFNVYCMLSGLKVTPYRSENDPDTKPSAFATIIGIHRGGDAAVKAEAEYNVDENADFALYADAAYPLYWGKQLFNDRRYFDAIHFLKAALNILLKNHIEANDGSGPLNEQICEAAFFLSICYVNINRPRDAYYYIDMIPHQSHPDWTRQFFTVITELQDPRTLDFIDSAKSFLNARKNEIDDPDTLQAIDGLLAFLNRQTIIVNIRSNRIDQAREALNGMLRSDPNDDFALNWLAKIG